MNGDEQQTPFLLATSLLSLAGGLVLGVWFLPEPHPARRWSVDELLRVRNLDSIPLVRVQGALVPGSLVLQQNAPCSAEFRIKGTERELLVRSASCTVPESLCKRPRWPTEVTVEGHLGASGTRLDAGSVWVKVEGKCEAVERPDGKISCAPVCS